MSGLPPLEQTPAKTILIRNKSTAWFGCEFNMNLYRGCTHGCVYCDSRSDCYHVERFDTVRVKENALSILRNELARKAASGMVATGAMSDPYNPYEAEAMVTRHALELLGAYGFGSAIATKSDLICRDIDVLSEIKTQSPVLCKITVTTCDDGLAAQLEPRAPAPSRRIEAIRQLASHGIFCGILLMPVLPFLEDSEQNVLEVVRRAAEAGARFVHPAFGVTMRAGQREYFLDRLEALYPGEGLAQKYRSAFGGRYHCSSPRARRLWEAFAAECRRLGLLFEMQDIVRAYKQGYGSGQLSLFNL